MMNERGEPRWELLPHNPVGFFELVGTFDRKMLKQRYTDLIRRFKPEKHPSEFQRIRAAFEASMQGSDSGKKSEQARRHFATIGPRVSPRQIHPRSARALRTPTLRASRRFTANRNKPFPWSGDWRVKIRVELYEELERRESKSAYDYYALAVLADLCEPRERPAFLQWILKGLRALPQEPGLCALLYEVLRQDDFGDENPKVLLEISRLFPSDQFYYFTETLWSRLIKRDSAERFAEALHHCEANLRDHRIGAKVAFYVHILRAALCARAILGSSDRWRFLRRIKIKSAASWNMKWSSTCNWTAIAAWPIRSLTAARSGRKLTAAFASFAHSTNRKRPSV